MRSWPERAGRAAVLLLALALAAPAHADRLTIPGEAVVEQDPVRLGDVAALAGPSAEVLADVVLAPAPPPGESRTLDGAQILERLRRAGLGGDVTYVIPALVRVRRASQELQAEALRPVIEEFVHAQLGDAAADTRVRTIEIPGTVHVPAGPWDAHVTVPPGTVLAGRVRMAVEVLQADRPVRSLWITTEIARPVDVVVATRAVARGELLGPGDVTVQRMDLPGLPRTVVSDPADAVGAVARQALVPFTPLRRDQIGQPTLVRRGERVLLVAMRGGLRITTSGEARADAARGESVVVVNRVSGKSITGRVVDEGTVSVEF
jgi:flagella basal body P-ring formation protein FlgA